MISKRTSLTFREYWANSRINYSVRVFIALVGVALPCWWYGASEAITPLVLGIIASALAETDDNFSGRLSALLTTLFCFAITTFSVEILFDYPLLFALGMVVSTFSFIMLGAIGPRYTSIAFASVLTAIYTMLGAQESPSLWFQPMLLIAGAAWYGLISLVWLLLWPLQPVQQSIALVFNTLSHYLDQKSEMFHPSRSLNPQPLRLRDANENIKVVNALNGAKTALMNRMRRGRVNDNTRQLLKIYFLAQDIHERANSSHYRYQDLAEVFFHSDVMFRLQHLLHLQAKACLEVSHCLTLSRPYRHGEQSVKALDELQESLIYIKAENNPEWNPLLSQLDFLFSNLATVERQLSNISNPDAMLNDEDKEIPDSNAHSFREKCARVWAQLTPKSLLFRHAVRLSLALGVGYGIIQAFDLTRGYWILLTILFVCQVNYSATRSKLTERVSGTLIGLLVGLPLLTLFPDLTGQLVLMVLFGVLFFAFRTTHYAAATAFITLLVLMCFNQLGEGYAVMLPRLGDTLIGCLLSVAAVRFVLPDWQAHRLRGIMKDSVTANRDYLGQIIGQYRIGKRDTMAYRVARRESHNQDAQLTTAISNMLAEPGRYRTAIDESFRFLCLNHAMLSYISTLGAHRMQMDDDSIHELVSKAHRGIHEELDCLITKLAGDAVETTPCLDDVLGKHLERWREEESTSARMVLQQLHLIHRILPEMHMLTDELAKKALKSSKS
ncbi:TIGR01666 family membrane protein [Enterovibrio norvegicus FF-454]|uniref:TIGR01666 family membrane protein n=1 Tax=Enterovibrio norvegicus FF-454 TaxID=1185651 RepID=A0A1E5C131_9GAMM|nr:YccS family putative transporter [Enterovibrio norvegicus]OEE59210.1 TIGR01666 family membrane protein [Enterovibrio norvegicus FF-454]